MTNAAMFTVPLNELIQWHMDARDLVDADFVAAAKRHFTRAVKPVGNATSRPRRSLYITRLPQGDSI